MKKHYKSSISNNHKIKKKKKKKIKGLKVLKVALMERP